MITETLQGRVARRVRDRRIRNRMRVFVEHAPPLYSAPPRVLGAPPDIDFPALISGSNRRVRAALARLREGLDLWDEQDDRGEDTEREG